jgi:hypothetical protein
MEHGWLSPNRQNRLCLCVDNSICVAGPLPAAPEAPHPNANLGRREAVDILAGALLELLLAERGAPRPAPTPRPNTARGGARRHAR